MINMTFRESEEFDQEAKEIMVSPKFMNTVS